MESFRKNNPCANGFEKEKKDAMRVVLILQAASRALYKHNYFFKSCDLKIVPCKL